MPGAPAPAPPGLPSKPGAIGPEPPADEKLTPSQKKVIEKEALEAAEAAKRQIENGRWVHVQVRVCPDPDQKGAVITECCEIIRVKKKICLKPPPCQRTASILWGVVAEIIGRALTAQNSGTETADVELGAIPETKEMSKEVLEALTGKLEKAVEIPQLEKTSRYGAPYSQFIAKVEIVPGKLQAAYEKEFAKKDERVSFSNPLPFGGPPEPVIVFYKPWVWEHKENFISAIDCDWRGVPLALVPKLASSISDGGSFKYVTKFKKTNGFVIEAAKNYMSGIPDRLFYNTLHPVAVNGKKRLYEVQQDTEACYNQLQSNVNYTPNCHRDPSLQQALEDQGKWQQPTIRYLNGNYTEPVMLGRQIETNGTSLTCGLVGWAIKSKTLTSR
jgi:hypothetical protein